MRKFPARPVDPLPIRNRLGLRLTLPIVALSLVLLSAGAGGAWYVHRLQKRASSMLARNVASIRVAEELEISIRELRTTLNQFLLAEDKRQLAAAPRLQRDIESWLVEADGLAESARERRLIELMRADHATFQKEFSTLDPAEARAIEVVRRLSNDVLTKEFLEHSRAFRDVNEELLAAGSERNRAMADRLSLALLLMGTSGALAGALAGWGLARGINRQIVQLSVPLRDVDGQLSEVVGPLTIATDQSSEDLPVVLDRISGGVGKVISQLQDTQREALRAEQLAAFGQLAAGLAHELRNPLTTMRILIQSALTARSADALDDQDLTVLDEEISRLEQFIQTLLDFARPAQPEKRDCCLSDMVRQTLQFISRRVRARHVVIETTLPEPDVRLKADSGQLRQLLLNLLLNALDAIPLGGRIEVEVTPGDRPSADEHAGAPAEADFASWVVLSVRDNGRGLPAELGDRIFEPFVTTTETGMGLGLSISRRIVEAHGGTLEARSRATGGAEFIVHLPIEAPAARGDALNVHAAGCR